MVAPYDAARMSGIGMVEPVMMVCYVDLSFRRIHIAVFPGPARDAGLAQIPEMIIIYRYVTRTRFYIDRSVAFFLIGVSPRRAVEEIAVMDPNVLVVGIQNYSRTGRSLASVHHSEVPYLKILDAL